MYKAYITYNSVEYDQIFIPENVAIENKEEDEELFFRRNLKGSLRAYKNAFDVINDAPFEAEFSFELKKGDVNNNLKEYFKGKFYKRDCKPNEDQRFIEFEVLPIDQYSPFIEGLNNEFNFLNSSINPVKSPCNYSNRSHIQVAPLGWIQENDDVSNKWSLITNSNITSGPYKPYARHFSPIPVDDSWPKVPGGYAFEINSSDANITDVFDGVELQFDSDPTPPTGFFLVPRPFYFGYDNDYNPPGSYPPFQRYMFIPNTYPTVINESVSYDRAISFWDGLKTIINEFDSTLLFDTTTEYSEFFFSAINPVTGSEQTLTNIRMLQKSDATFPYGNASKSGQITFKEMLDVIKFGFGAYWFIKDGKFRIEHRSYFDNGGVYFNINNQGTNDPEYDQDYNDIVSVIDGDSNFSFTQVATGWEFEKINDDSYDDPVIELGSFNFFGQSMPAKNARVSFDYKIESYLVPTGESELTELVSLHYEYGGLKGIIEIDPENSNTFSVNQYLLNKTSSSTSRNIRFYLVFKPKVQAPNTERYRVLTGLKLSILNLELKFYDTERVVGIDLNKYISMKNKANILQNTNSYEYEYGELLLRERYEWQEEYNRNLFIVDNRTIKLDNLAVNYKDEPNTDWIQNGEDTYNISVFVSQINDYLISQSQNLTGWILLDVDDLDNVRDGYVDLYLEQNASFYMFSLYLKFNRFNNVYSSFLFNDQKNANGERYNTATLVKIKIQDEITGLILLDDLDPIKLVKTKIGNGQIQEYNVNLNSRNTTLKLKYDY